MDIATIIMSTALLGGAAGKVPKYDFKYNYLDEKSVVQSVSGSHFYRPKYPEVSIRGLTHIGNTGLVWGITTPFVSDKFKRGLNFSGTLYHDFKPSDKTTLRTSISFATLAREVSRPCLDSIGRQFHCYYGTQPNHSYFYLPYDQLDSLIYKKQRTFEVLSVGFTWTLTF